jgi:hypothetical protein
VPISADVSSGCPRAARIATGVLASSWLIPAQSRWVPCATREVRLRLLDVFDQECIGSEPNRFRRKALEHIDLYGTTCRPLAAIFDALASSGSSRALSSRSSQCRIVVSQSGRVCWPPTLGRTNLQRTSNAAQRCPHSAGVRLRRTFPGAGRT